MEVDATLASPSVYVQAGEDLSGDGTVGAVTSTGGTISPAYGALYPPLSPCTLTVASLSLDSNSTVNILVQSTSEFGVIDSTGNVVLAGTLNVTSSSSEFDSTDHLDIIPTGGTATGQFTGLPESAVVDAVLTDFRITYAAGRKMGCSAQWPEHDDHDAERDARRWNRYLRPDFHLLRDSGPTANRRDHRPAHERFDHTWHCNCVVW